MKRMMLVVAMVAALAMSAMAPALASGPAYNNRGAATPDVVPFSTWYICSPTNPDHQGGHWGNGDDITVEVRTNNSVQIHSPYTDRSLNGHLVDYGVHYWEWDDGEVTFDSVRKRHVSAASANISCYNQNTFGEPYGWNGLILEIRLGNGQYRHWMDVTWPGWDADS